MAFIDPGGAFENITDFDSAVYEGAFSGFWGINQEYRTGEEINASLESRMADMLAGRETIDNHFPPEVGPTQTVIVMENDDQVESEKEKPNEARGMDFSWNPFNLVIRGIKLPLIGAMELTLRKATTGAKIWFSWIYKELGYSSTRIRLAILGIADVPRAKIIITKPDPRFAPCPIHEGDGCGQMQEAPDDDRDLLYRCSGCSLDMVLHECADYLDQGLLTVRTDDSTRLLSITTSFEWQPPTMGDWFSMVTNVRINGLPLCPHKPEDFDHNTLPRRTPDGLGLIPPNNRWRGAELSEGLRCTICNPDQHHGIFPVVRQSMLTIEGANITDEQVESVIRFTVASFQAHATSVYRDDPSRIYHVTAASANRRLELLPENDKYGWIVIVDDESLIRNHPQRNRLDVYWIVVPRLPNQRYLASWRVLYALFCTDPLRMIVTNACNTKYDVLNLALLRSHHSDGATMSVGNFWPAYMGAAAFLGGVLRHGGNQTPGKGKLTGHNLIASFLALGWVYGWDETYVAYKIKTVTLSSITTIAPGLLAPNMTASYVGPRTHLAMVGASWDPRPTCHEFVAKRSSIYYLAKYHDEAPVFSMLDWLKVLGDPRPIQINTAFYHFNGDASDNQILRPGNTLNSVADTWPLEIQWDDGTMKTLRAHSETGAAENILSELSLESGGIKFLTFGSHGDRVPILAYARWLRARGALATVIHLNTNAEGILLLKYATGRANPVERTTAISIFARARRYALDTPGLVLVPEQLRIKGLSYSLAPPKDKIFGFQPTGEHLLNILYRLMSVFTPEPLHIGAYYRPGWLPRSANGVDFLTAQRNTGEIDSLAAWGSDNLAEPGFEGVKLVEPGDHVAQFRKAKVVYTHGGAGTVQTAAACGARVVALGTTLDRSYRDPFDAGSGVEPGAPPDRLLLALARADSRYLAIWLRANWYKPWAYFSWLGGGPVGYAIFRLLMLYLVYKRVHSRSIVSTDPMTTMLLVITRVKPDWRTYAVCYLGARMADQILEAFQVDYPWLIRTFISVNYRMAESMIGMYLAQARSVSIGLAWAIVAPRVMAGCVLLFQGLISWATESPDKGTPYYRLEYSFTTWYGFPVFHTALVHGRERYEGTFHSNSIYGFDFNDKGRQKWSFTLPTNLTRAVLESAPPRVGAYGIFWNCQTGLLVQAQDHLHNFGPSLFPLCITAGIAASASAVMYAGLLLGLGATSFFPGTIASSDPRARQIESIIATSLMRISATVYKGTVLTPVAAIDWARALTAPFTGATLDGRPIQELLEEFRQLPILYQVDPETIRRYKMQLSTLVLAGNTVLDAALFLSQIDDMTVDDPDFMMQLETETASLKTSFLGSDAYHQYVLGAAGMDYLQLYETIKERAPREFFDTLMRGVGFEQAVAKARDKPADPLLALELYHKLNDYMGEVAPQPEFVRLVSAKCHELARVYPRRLIQFVLIALLENGQTLDTTISSQEPDGSRITIPAFLPRNDFPDLVRSVIRRGLEKFIPARPTEPPYQGWHYNARGIVQRGSSEAILKTFDEVFPLPLENLVDTSEYMKDYSVIVTGEVQAAMRTSGVSIGVARGVSEILLGALLRYQEEHTPNVELNFRKWLWAIYVGKAQEISTIPERVGAWLIAIRRFCTEYSLPFTVFNSLANLFTTIGLSLYQIIDKLIEILVGVVETAANFTLTAFSEYLYLGRAFMSLLLPEQRRRPKAVWALLFANDFSRLSNADKFIMSCKMMDEPPEYVDYDTWADTVIKELNDTNLADVVLEKKEPLRPVRYPFKATTVLEPEIRAQVEMYPDKVDIPDGYKKFVERWAAAGVPRGISGSYFATPDRVAASIKRYAVERVPVSTEIDLLMDRTVDALVEHYPHLYTDGKFMTPKQVIKNLKVKYSPGLPFIPTYKSRKDLYKHGFLDAIAQVAENRLTTGITPGTMAHAFVKDQVVDLQKLLGVNAPPKNIRTVVAQDLIGNVIKWTATLETTRRPPREEDWVMNAVKHTEGGFRKAYDAIRLHKHVFMADATEFDSKLHPVITTRGLPRLRSHAYRGQFGQDVKDSQIKSHYLAMRYCRIMDLQYGRQFGHTGGFMTGQADTSPDNKDAFRLMIISAWAAVAGRDPKFFWEKNTLINAGDDDVIGTDEERELWDLALQWITDNYGVVMRVEAEGFENVALTALNVMGVPPHSIKYYNNIGLAVPEYAIGFEEERLLHRKMEFPLSTGRLVGEQWKQAQTLSIVGSTWLTAHQPHLYADMAKVYLDLVTNVLTRYYLKLNIQETYDEEGILVALTVDPGRLRDRYNKPEVDQRFRNWIKGVRFPTYRQIMDVWLKPNDIPNARVTKTHNKIMSWIPAIPWADRVTFGLITVRESLYKWVPNHVVKPIEYKGEEVSYIMRNQDYVVAKFVWLSLLKKTNKVPTAQAFRTALRECPYASAEDPIGFIDWLATGRNLEKLVKEDLEAYRGQMLSVTLIYYYIETVFKALNNVPYAGWLVHLFALATRDVNRLYALLNFVYMLSEGRSSVIISNMMPNDPYAWIKQFAVITTCLVPTKWHNYPGLKYVVKVVPMIVELWAAAAVTVKPNVFNRAVRRMALPNDWLTVHQRLMALLQNGTTDVMVVAPTATGKSTAFVGALDQIQRFYSTLWILCPTNVSVGEYSNIFVDENLVQKLSLGEPNNYEKRIKVLTYGHFLTRMDAGEVQPTDALLLDEFHLMSVEMVATWFRTTVMVRIAVTATPTPLMPDFGDAIIRYTGSRRFQIEAHYYNQDWVSLWQLLAANSPDCLKRALIVCPTLASVQRVRNTLGRISVASHELSSDNPNVSTTGVIVATTVVDVAITIDPPPTVLIDLGETVQIDLLDDLSILPTYKASVVPTSPSANRQREGRVGRTKSGLAYHLNQAGQGIEPQPMPSAASLLSHPGYDQAIAASYGIKLVFSVLNPALKTILRFVRPSVDLEVTNARDGIVALSLYIFFHLSSGLQLEDVRLIHNNHRLGLFYESIQAIVRTEIEEIGAGDPLVADFDTAINWLTAGCLEVLIGEERFPATCLVNRGNRIILPPQIDPKSFVSTPPAPIGSGSWRYRPRPNAMTRTQWIQSLINDQMGADQIYGQCGPIVPWNPTEYNEVAVTLFGSPLFVTLYTQFRETYRLIDPNTKVIPLDFEDDDPLPIPYRRLVVTTRRMPVPRGADMIDLTNLALGPISRTTLAWLIASVAPDDFCVIYGVANDYLVATRLEFPFEAVLIYSENPYRSGIIKSSVARRHAHTLYAAHKSGQGDAYIATIPHMVMFTGPGQAPLGFGNFQYFDLEGRHKIVYR